MKVMTKTAFTVGLLALLMVVPAFGSVNSSIKIEAGSESSGDVSTATIGGVSGVMSIDDAVRFSGERP